jgi:hypothetical protein
VHQYWILIPDHLRASLIDSWEVGDHVGVIGAQAPQAVGVLGTADAVRDKRAGVLSDAYAAHPERFVRKPPEPPKPPTPSWINKPDDTQEATH